MAGPYRLLLSLSGSALLQDGTDKVREAMRVNVELDGLTIDTRVHLSQGHVFACRLATLTADGWTRKDHVRSTRNVGDCHSPLTF
ncbi:MAG: hypothetical protein ACXVK3_19075 [Candidatus Angelobacter sp.]